MQPNILVIEDEQSIADVIVYNLQKEGFIVHWERDGRDGLLKAQTLIPDLCLLDLMLPGIDGLQICRLLKSDARTKAVPVMMLTARNPRVMGKLPLSRTMTWGGWAAAALMTGASVLFFVLL